MITHVAAASAGGFQASVTVDVPAGTTDGDLLLAWLSANDADTLTPPSGWSRRLIEPVGAGTSVWLYSRTATDEPASYTWEWNADHHHHVIVSAWRGVSRVRGDAVASAEDVTSVDMPSLMAVAGDVLVGFGFHWGTTAGSEPAFPAGMDTLITQSTIIAAAQETISADGATTAHTVSSTELGRMAAAAVVLEPVAEDSAAARRASYEFFVDWDNDGGLALSHFEAGVDGWYGYPEPPVPPDPPAPVDAAVRATSSAQSASASFSVSTPAGTAEGDVLIAYQTANLGAASALTTPTGGAAWVQLGSTITGGTDQLHTKVWWKVAGASEPTSYGFAQATGSHSVVAIAAIRDADTARTPIIAAFDPLGSDTSIPTPPTTPAFHNDLELRWAGAQYTTPPPQQHTKTYDATWSASWYGFGKRSGSRLYQGDTQLGDGTGYQYGKVGFDDAAIRADLVGATIDKVELRMSNEHSWYNSGLTARFGSHNNASEPTGSTSTDGSFNRSAHSWNKGQTKYVTLPVAIGEELRDNTTKGVTTGRPTAGSRSDYGYFRGYDATSSQKPRLRITYTTASTATISLTGPAKFTQRTNQNAGDATAGALATRQLQSDDDTGTHAFTASETFARAHGVTVNVASVQPEPDPGLPDLSPALSQTTTRARSGTGSLLAEWTDDSPDQSARRTLDRLLVARAYTLTAWVYVPTGSPPARLDVADLGVGVTSTVVDAWEQLTVTFTATATEHTALVHPATAAASGDVVYVDSAQMVSDGEDITSRVLGLRTAVDISLGRDHARSLSAISPGQTGMEVNNISRDYSPDNPASPLAGLLAGGRPVLIRATRQGVVHNLFWGHLDDYQLDPDRNTRAVHLTALDALALLRGAKVSTRLYPSLRTGEAIGVLLDEIGWPADRRDLDAGATTLRWWWGESDDAFDVLATVVEAEGPTAFAFVSANGDFVFRDRHHRLMREASLQAQTTFRDTGAEPVFAEATYNIGWKDIVNSVEVAVDEREPERRQVVWEDQGVIALTGGEVRTIRVQADAPFLRALTPVPGLRLISGDSVRISPLDADYILQSGQVDVTLSRTSGQSTEIRLQAGTAGAVLHGLRLRACPVTVARTVQIRAEDPESIAEHGRRSYDGDLELAGVHDVADIAQLILGQRAQRLPVMTITVVGAGHSERMRQILTRDLSDRVRVVEEETFTDHDHYIERVDHAIADVGYDHRAVFGLERVREQHVDALVFDDPARGFDDGVFAMSGIDEPDQICVLDESHLDERLLGH